MDEVKEIEGAKIFFLGWPEHSPVLKNANILINHISTLSAENQKLREGIEKLKSVDGHGYLFKLIHKASHLKGEEGR